MAMAAIGRVRAKRIRRRLETVVANGEYLCRSHDTRETALLARGLRRVDGIAEELRRLRTEFLLLLEIDEQDENVRHRELWQEGRGANMELAECEEPVRQPQLVGVAG